MKFNYFLKLLLFVCIVLLVLYKPCSCVNNNSEFERNSSGKNVPAFIKKDTVKPIEHQAQTVEQNSSWQISQEISKRALFFILLITLMWSLVTTVLFVRYFFYYKKEKIKLVHAKDLLNEAKENSRKIRDERDEFYKGFEKNKELLGYEHNTVEQLRNALSDLKKREFEEMRAELDIRTKYLEQKLRAEMLNKQEGEFNFKETMFKHGQEELSNNIIQGISVEEVTSPAVNALRDWVSLMAVNLYESAPDSVMDFLVKFSNDNNPLIRMNVIPVLDRIASDETVAILLKLYHDTDNRVQREVLKSLLELEKKIVNGEVKLQKDKVDQVNMILKNERSGGEWIF